MKVEAWFMKKIALLVLVPLLFCCSTLMFSMPVNAGSSIDQQFTGGTGSLLISTGQRMAQRFMAEKRILDKIEIELVNVDANKKLSVNVYKWNGSAWDEGSIASVVDQVVTNGWNTFDFTDVDLGNSYFFGIFVSGDYGPQWKYADESGYGSGYAIWQNNNYYNWDFNFKTWGTDPVEIIDENTQPNQPANSNSTVSPSDNASSSIVKPTNLKATYSESKAGVELTWTASATADIDGYIVFRSETQGKNHVQVGKTGKNGLTYLDQKSVAGKTYYYLVRAYKSSSQSASSNEAIVTVPADASPAMPADLKVDYFSDSSIKVSWSKNAETNIASYNLKITTGEKTIKTASVGPDLLSYNFSGLSPNTKYVIELTAVNDEGKISAPAEVLQKTTVAMIQPVSSGGYEMTPALWSMMGVATLLLLILVCLMYRREQKAKKALR